MSRYVSPYIETTDAVYDEPGGEPIDAHSATPPRLPPSKRRNLPVEPVEYERLPPPIVDPIEPKPAPAAHAPESAPVQEPVVVQKRETSKKGSGMAKRIGMTLAVIVLCIVGYFAIQRYHDLNGFGSDGTVTDTSNERSATDPVPTPAPEPASTKPIVYPPAQTTVVAAAPVQTAPAQTTTTTSMSAPATDSMEPNAPNGMAFAGTGKFQVYRQGNITWRINTDTGHSCILFATDEEWRKPKVYSRGCGDS